MLSGEQLKLFTKTGICSSVSSLHLHWRFCYDISGTIGDPPEGIKRIPCPPPGQKIVRNKKVLKGSQKKKVVRMTYVGWDNNTIVFGRLFFICVISSGLLL